MWYNHLKFECLTVVKMLIMGLWVMMPCSLCGYTSIFSAVYVYPEDRSDMFHQSVGNTLQGYMVSQLRRPQSPSKTNLFHGHILLSIFNYFIYNVVSLPVASSRP
jgi:hypothetical protein